MRDETTIFIGPGLATILGIGEQPTRGDAATALARIADLPDPARPSTQLVLSEIVSAIQCHVIDHPHLPLDRAMAADFALSHAANAVGPEALQDVFDELGGDALDHNVRGAIYTTVVSGLKERGLIRIVGR